MQMNKEKQVKFHKILIESLFKRFPDFKTKYITLQNLYSYIEGKYVIQVRIRGFLKEFVQNFNFRKPIILFYKANKKFFSLTDQNNIDRLTQERDRFTDIYLTNLLQASVYQQIMKHHY